MDDTDFDNGDIFDHVNDPSGALDAPGSPSEDEPASAEAVDPSFDSPEYDPATEPGEYTDPLTEGTGETLDYHAPKFGEYGGYPTKDGYDEAWQEFEEGLGRD